MKFPEKKHPAYDHMDAEKIMGERNGTQAGDPKKGGQAMYKLAVLDGPPLRAVIGSDAHSAIHEKIKLYGENYGRDDLSKIANSTDAEGYKRPQ